jgi:TRAP transporter TAXI family solute receptor
VPRRRVIAVLLAVLVPTLLAGCGRDGDPLPQQRLAIATGAAGGVYERYGRGLRLVIERRLPRLRARAIATAGSVENLERVGDGRADIGFTRADSASDMLRGNTSIVALARLYDSYVQVVVRPGSGISSVKQLARCGKRRCRVATGQPGSGTALIADRVLTQAGLGARDAVERVDDRDIDEAADALIDGSIDAVFWAGGLPTPAIDKVKRRVGIQLVGLGEIAAGLRRRFPNEYSETRLPRRVYDTKRSIVTVSVTNYLVARGDLDDQVAYRLTGMLFEHRDELAARGHGEARYLDRRAAIDTYPLKLHDGARRYYRDAAR